MGRRTEKFCATGSALLSVMPFQTSSADQVGARADEERLISTGRRPFTSTLGNSSLAPDTVSVARFDFRSSNSARGASTSSPGNDERELSNTSRVSRTNPSSQSSRGPLQHSRVAATLTVRESSQSREATSKVATEWVESLDYCETKDDLKEVLYDLEGVPHDLLFPEIDGVTDQEGLHAPQIKSSQSLCPSPRTTRPEDYPHRLNRLYRNLAAIYRLRKRGYDHNLVCWSVLLGFGKIVADKAPKNREGREVQQIKDYSSSDESLGPIVKIFSQVDLTPFIDKISDAQAVELVKSFPIEHQRATRADLKYKMFLENWAKYPLRVR